MLSLVVGVQIMSSFLNADLVRVTDGDTFVVNLPIEQDVFATTIPVRIKGINTPEVRTTKACEKRDGKNAKALLEGLFTSKKLDLHFCERDMYFRILCAVHVGDKTNAADYMLESGYAVPYFGDTKKAWKCKK